MADPNFFDRLYSYAWFVTFGLSFVAYLGLMRSRGDPTRPNCFTTEDTEDTEEQHGTCG